MRTIPTVRITENYRDYRPPSWFRPAVERLLGSLDPQHLGNLEAVVLTNSAAIGKGKSGRVSGRKYRLRECRGFYHHGTRDARPWIELVTDNIVGKFKRPLLDIMRDLLVGPALYHEVGHHLHETVGSAARGGEASADDWSARLMEVHYRRCYRRLNRFISWIDKLTARAG